MSTDPNNEVLTNLKFLGKIEKGQKIVISTMTLQSDGIFTKLLRTFYYTTENRHKTLKFIERTLTTCFSLIAAMQHSTRFEDKESLRQILADLEKSLTGLSNLKETYADDPWTVSAIEKQSENVHAKLKQYTNTELSELP